MIPNENARILVKIPKWGTCYIYNVVNTKDISNIVLFNETLNEETIVDYLWFNVSERIIEFL